MPTFPKCTGLVSVPSFTLIERYGLILPAEWTNPTALSGPAYGAFEQLSASYNPMTNPYLIDEGIMFSPVGADCRRKH